MDILKSFLSIDFSHDDKVFLLGDIFDLLIGPHDEYKEIFDWFFNRIDELVKKGVEIHYFEGNHDFHLEKLLVNYGIRLHKEPLVYEINGKKALLCHGDEIEIGNLPYKIYKSFVQSRPLNVVANYLMPFKILNMIGENASKKSRKRNKNKYGNSQENLSIRDSFREAARIASKEYGTDFVICGHSHFKDEYEWEGKQYFNCGFTPNTKCYLKIANEKIEHVDI